MKSETLHIDLRKKKINAELIAIQFQDCDSEVLYIPSLNISAYGDTFAEAKQMLKIELNELSSNLVELTKKEVLAYLKQFGWEEVKLFKKRLINLQECDKNRLKKDFNLPDETKFRELPIAV